MRQNVVEPLGERNEFIVIPHVSQESSKNAYIGVRFVGIVIGLREIMDDRRATSC